MTTITAEIHEGYAVDLSSTEGHTWRADEPQDKGGSGTGPDPYELLLGALAACTSITISMYCQRKGWGLDGVSAEFFHDRVHADDCRECEDEQHGYIDRIQSHITIAGTFDDDQQRRLREAAERCPVRKTLQKGMVVADDFTFES